MTTVIKKWIVLSTAVQRKRGKELLLQEIVQSVMYLRKRYIRDGLPRWYQTLPVRSHMMFNLDKAERNVKMVRKEKKQNTW